MAHSEPDSPALPTSRSEQSKTIEPRDPEGGAPVGPRAPGPRGGVQRTALDKVMRSALLVGLGVVMTAPLWCTDDMTRNFRPTTFRADRSGSDTAEGAESELGAVFQEVIRTAAADEMVEEDVVAARIADVLAKEELGDDESRRAAAMEAIGDIVARAAEARRHARLE